MNAREIPYREPAPRPDGYRAAWADLLRRRRSNVASLAATVVVGFAVSAALAIAGPYGLGALVPAAFAWRELWRMPSVDRFVCPACGKRFASTADGFHDDSTRCCLRCGIAIGTPKGAP